MKITFGKFAAMFTLILCCAWSAFAQTERERGIDLYEKGDYKAAAAILEKATQADKKDGEAWRFLAMVYTRANELKLARKAFGKAVDFDDKDLKANYDTPIKIISKSPAKYTEQAMQNQTVGRVKLAVEFGADGKIKYIVPIVTLPYGLTESAVKAARGIQFEPAIRNGKTVTVISFVEYTFK